MIFEDAAALQAYGADPYHKKISSEVTMPYVARGVIYDYQDQEWLGVSQAFNGSVSCDSRTPSFDLLWGGERETDLKQGAGPRQAASSGAG